MNFQVVWDKKLWLQWLNLWSKLIIADEPTTALDIYYSSSNIRFNEGFKEKLNTSIILITTI